MGQKNIVLKTYMNKPERIQSVLEYYTKEKLPGNWASRCEEKSGFYPVVNSKGVITHRERDILKRVKTASGSYLLGIENQEKINLIFPWRLMQMDCLTYERQIEEIQERNERKNKEQNLKFASYDDYLYRYRVDDSLEPVVNLTLYWGKKKWQRPLSLKDMVKFSELPVKIKEMFKNYGVNIVDMRSIPEEALEEMKSDLKYVLGIMKCGNSSIKYIEYIKKHEEFFSRIPKSAADVINVCMNIKKINELLEYTQPEDGEECADMCKAVDDMIKHSEERGRIQGRRQGRRQGRKQGRDGLLMLIQKMTEAGEAGLIPRLSQEPEFLKSMYKKYKLEF